MGRKPCCAKEGVNRGAWTPKEDRILTTYINIHGEGKWRSLPQNADLNRCGKSCRLRWLNYLKPDIKRGNISVEEEDLIIRLHRLLGNRWSLIAKRLPGRTDNEIKNYWNTTLSKRKEIPENGISNREEKKSKGKENVAKPHRVMIRTKAIKCTKVVQLDNQMSAKGDSLLTSDRESPSSSSPPEDNYSSDLFMDLDINDILLSDFSDLEFNEEKGGIGENYCGINGDFNGINMSFNSEFSVESLLNSNCSDESILMEDLEAMAATLDQLIDDSEPRFNGVESFFKFGRRMVK